MRAMSEQACINVNVDVRDVRFLNLWMLWMSVHHLG